jgi:predicted nucleotidyltransferase component of viral defense system
MPSLSEFIAFVSENSGIRNLELIEKDIMLHRILKEIHSSDIGDNYLFKGGSCLVKCYFGYYRFSVDLDFTWKDQEVWKGLGKKKLRRELIDKITSLGLLLQRISKKLDLDFEATLKDKRFLEFGGGGKLATFKLWKGSELVKIQVNFIERILFKPKKMTVRTLLNRAKLKKDEETYFDENLDSYQPFKVSAYDEREILCEKVRAILTRKAQKLRDFFDLFVLHKHGFQAASLEDEIVEKTKAVLYYKKYRDALEKNRNRFEIQGGILEDPFERKLLVKKPTKEFEDFLKTSIENLKKVAITINEESQ